VIVAQRIVKVDGGLVRERLDQRPVDGPPTDALPRAGARLVPGRVLFGHVPCIDGLDPGFLVRWKGKRDNHSGPG
jgi:hypothetical protein